jgi:hypothetical protein
MSFFKGLKNRVTPPKATLTLRLNKTNYVLGENIGGSANISSQEDFDATELRCEIQCVEEVRRLKRVYDERLRVYVERPVQESAILYEAKPNVAGRLKITQGYNATFPVSASIPAGGRTTYKSVDNKVAWFIKGVVAIDGRPDITTGIIELQVIQPTMTVAGTAPGVSVQATPVVKEVVREIVMIPCKYCGGLMPQTQTVCPNCGAKRTG